MTDGTCFLGTKPVAERDVLEMLLKRKFNVLVCDDSQDDRFLTKHIINRSWGLKHIGAVTSGKELCTYLLGMEPFSDRQAHPFPDLILLDIDMQHWNGLQFLEWLQKQTFNHPRVVVLSGTEDPDKIRQALALGADYFQSKSSDPAVITEFVHRLELLMTLLANRQHLTSQKAYYMTHNCLEVVDGRGPPSTNVINSAAGSGRNFILVLEDERALAKLWGALGAASVNPDRLHRWGILGMAEALTQESYKFLLELYDTAAVYLVEQLTLNRNIPPLVKPIILYCELRGIISQHNTVEEAGISLLQYLERSSATRLLPLAGIYEYRQQHWQRVKRLSSTP